MSQKEKDKVPKPLPITQKSLDASIHAAKRVLKSYKDVLLSPADAVTLGGKVISKGKVKAKVVGAEKYLHGLKLSRGRLQTSPSEQGATIPPAEKQTGKKSPAYLRRLQLRALLRENEKLKKIASEPRPDLAPPPVVLPVTFDLLKSVPDFTVNFTLPAAGTLFEFTSPTAGIVRISRTKPTASVSALDQVVDKKAVRLGLLRKGSDGNVRFELKADSLSMDQVFLLGALHTFRGTMPGDFSNAPTRVV